MIHTIIGWIAFALAIAAAGSLAMAVITNIRVVHAEDNWGVVGWVILTLLNGFLALIFWAVWGLSG